MTDDEYLGELALRLRWRHVGEAVVRTELTKVVGATGSGEQTRSERFGEPDAYAKTIPKGKSASIGFLVASAIAGIAIVGVGVKAFSVLVLRQPQDFLISLAVYGGAFVVVLVGTAIGSKIDRRLPEGL